MADRGMKKWAPYKSLIEQEDSLKRLQTRTEKIERPILSSDEEEEINDILVNYHSQPVEIKYYRNERIYTITSTIEKIDINNRRLVLEEKKIVYLQELVGLRNI